MFQKIPRGFVRIYPVTVNEDGTLKPVLSTPALQPLLPLDIKIENIPDTVELRGDELRSHEHRNGGTSTGKSKEVDSPGSSVGSGGSGSDSLTPDKLQDLLQSLAEVDFAVLFPVVVSDDDATLKPIVSSLIIQPLSSLPEYFHAKAASEKSGEIDNSGASPSQQTFAPSSSGSIRSFAATFLVAAVLHVCCIILD